MMSHKNETSNLILKATGLRMAFSTVERLFCFGLFHFPSYAFALLIKRPSCIICISTANIALRTTCEWKNACEFSLLIECPSYKNEIVGFLLNKNTCNLFFYICSSDLMSVFTLSVYVSEQTELFH